MSISEKESQCGEDDYSLTTKKKKNFRVHNNFLKSNTGNEKFVSAEAGIGPSNSVPLLCWPFIGPNTISL